MKAHDLEMLILEHWRKFQQKSQKLRIPARSDIDLGSLGIAHNNSFILKKTADTSFVIRIGARAFNNAMQMDVRGMQLVSLFHPATRARALDMIDKTFSFPAYQRVGLTIGPELNAPMTSILLLLPLTGMGGFVDHALGGYIPQSGETCPEGHRFYPKSEETRPIKTRTPIPALRPNAYEAAETPAPFISKAKKSHLRLVSSENNLHHSQRND